MYLISCCGAILMLEKTELDLIHQFIVCAVMVGVSK